MQLFDSEERRLPGIIMREKNRTKGNTIFVITAGLDLDTPNFLQNITKILLSAFSGRIFVILSGVAFLKTINLNERICIKQVMIKDATRKRENTSGRIVKYILTQLKISYILAKENKADGYIFFLAQSLIIPILTLKILRRKIILVIGASNSELSGSKRDRLLLIPKIEERINYELSDHIILYSPCLKKQWNLEKYTKKICIATKHFIDVKKFKIITRLSDRNDLIGYIGRLSEEKGPMNFVKAIPEISLFDREIKFMICGNGSLTDNIKKHLSEKNLNINTKFLGWIPHDELPEYLNKLKLLVIPSYTEGLPNIMLEAMACGTPILATPVGSIPDFIKDGETGFILENNSPECITANVIRAIEHPELVSITKCARALVENGFIFDKAVDRWRRLLTELLEDRQ